MSAWKKKRLGKDYCMGHDRRQIRVGQSPEPVAVIRVLEPVGPGDEIVLTPRMIRWAAIGYLSELGR